jgi:VanZ family protein
VTGSTSRQRSLSAWLTAAWVAVIVYASLFPFSGWRWPAGATAWGLLPLPWPHWHDRFDQWSNFVAYVPLGCLLAMRWGPAAVAIVIGRVTLQASALSYTLELMQFSLPQRVPSLEDWLLNTAGALAGAWIGAGLRQSRWRQAVAQARERWFERHGPASLGLLALWPVGLLFPTPVPLGLGQVWDRLRDQLGDVLLGAGWAESLLIGLGPGSVVPTPLAPPTELMAVALGLLGPTLVSFCITRSMHRRGWLAAGATVLAAGVTTLSTALNFGPQHALAWCTPTALGGIALGLVLAIFFVRCSVRVAAGIALMAITAAVALVAQAPADPYFAESLSGWEQGRFIRFHGLAQWIGWGWPYVAMAWLLVRIGERET